MKEVRMGVCGGREDEGKESMFGMEKNGTERAPGVRSQSSPK